MEHGKTPRILLFISYFNMIYMLNKCTLFDTGIAKLVSNKMGLM